MISDSHQEKSIAEETEQINMRSMGEEDKEPQRQWDVYDIANFVDNKLLNSEKNEVLRKLWSPSETFIYPSSGKRNLKFQGKWLSEWKWLSYSKKVDGAFCKFCVLFNKDFVGKGSHQKMGQLCSEQFCNWKKARERFSEHQQSLYHRNNVEVAHIIMKIETKQQDSIDVQLDDERKKQIMDNRTKLVPIIETVLFCGKQGLSLRGHRDSGRVGEDAEENEGNFRELLRYRAKYDENLQKSLANSKSNALYTSWKIQNEILEISNTLILDGLLAKINSSSYFSVLVDEATDISGVQQMSLCIRCTDFSISNVEELFLQFVPLHDVTGKGIAATIIDKLKDLGIDMTKLRGQGYDGASNLSGKFNGVQAHVQALFPKALYVHCAAHSLNLAVSNSCEVPSIRNCLGTIGKLYDFFHTPKRQSVLEKCLEEAEIRSTHGKLKQLCATRWVERYTSVAIFLELYDGIVLALDRIAEDKGWADSANAAHQLNCTVKRADFVIGLYVINQIFSYSSILCKALQQRSIDLKKACDLAEDTALEIRMLRQNANSEFHQLFLSAKMKGEKFDFPLNIPRIANKQMLRYNVDAASSEDYYRVSVYIPFLDAFLNNLEQRFSKHKSILTGFQSLLPADPNRLSEETLNEFQSLVSFYNSDLNGTVDELKIELKFWYRAIARLKKDDWPKDSLSALRQCEENIFPNIRTLLHILTVLPVSTSENERTFSTLRRLKNYLRNSTSETRLNGLALLHLYRKMTPSTESILDKMAEKTRKIDISLK